MSFLLTKTNLILGRVFFLPQREAESAYNCFPASQSCFVETGRFHSSPSVIKIKTNDDSVIWIFFSMVITALSHHCEIH